MPLSNNGEGERRKDEKLAQVNRQEARKRTQNRLAQSRHRAKVRQQKEALSLELVVPSSFATSRSCEGNTSSSRDTSTALCYDQDVQQDFLNTNQPQIRLDNFDDFNSLNLLSPQQMVAETIGPQTPSEISGSTLAMPPHMSHPTLGNSYPPAGNSHETFLSPALPLGGELSNGYWTGDSMGEPQWNHSGYSHDLSQCSKPVESNNSARSTSTMTTRPSAGPNFRRTSTSISDPQVSAPCGLAQAPDSRTSSVNKRSSSKRAIDKSGRRPQSTRSEPDTGDMHSSYPHCRSCGACNEPGFPKGPVKTPSQAVSRDSSLGHLDVLAQCDKALAQLLQQSDDEGEHGPSPRPTRRRRRPQDRSAADSDIEVDGQNAVDKVVIMYIKNKRKSTGV
ncbi:MAG: hypothetical protein LQ342_004458 [Letrouitia transgressa]|nr:MAG: hypothetical protein LQ342_004458 [Letrouitia transgressa]